MSKVAQVAGGKSEIQTHIVRPQSLGFEPRQHSASHLCQVPVAPDENTDPWSYPNRSKKGSLGVHMRAWEPRCPKVGF